MQNVERTAIYRSRAKPAAFSRGLYDDGSSVAVVLSRAVAGLLPEMLVGLSVILMKRLSGTRHSASAFISIAVAFMINMMGTTLPTPIYRFYQQQYGFTPTLIAVIYACYAVGVLGALLTVGNWSDQLGRRRMLFVGLCASAASAIAFITSHGAAGLMIGRLLSGLSAGIFTSTRKAGKRVRRSGRCCDIRATH